MTEENVIEVNNYDGIQVDLYDGKYSLLAMQKGQNEVWYKRWVFLSRWKDGKPVADEKKMPMCVRLGDKEQARQILKSIWEQIGGLK